MIAGGFFIKERKGYARKRTCTQAFSLSENCDQKLNDRLKNSPTNALSDENYQTVLKLI